MSQVLHLPYPPSVNGVFRKHNGSRLAEAYRAWRDAAGWKLQAQRPRKFTGPVKLLLEFRAPDRRVRDIDNLLKAPLDLLVKHKVIEADNSSCLREVTGRWVEAGEPCTITITSLAEAAAETLRRAA